MIRDFNIDWLEKRVWIPAQAFQTFVTGAGIAAGDPVFQEISSFGITGIQINQANDAISHVWMVPYDFDRSKQMRFRVWASSSSTDADAETITLTYSALTASGTLVAPITALSTAIPAVTFSATANALTVTDFGILNRNTLATDTAFMNLSVASTMTNASANEISLLGLEVRYTPRRTAGPRKNILGARRLLTAYPLGVQLHATQEGL